MTSKGASREESEEAGKEEFAEKNSKETYSAQGRAPKPHVEGETERPGGKEKAKSG